MWGVCHEGIFNIYSIYRVFCLNCKIIDLKVKKPIVINHYWLLFYQGRILLWLIATVNAFGGDADSIMSME
jgi:hypothetical protein